MTSVAGNRRSEWGNVSKLRSGNFRARYTAPDGTPRAIKGTFRTRTEAREALNRLRVQIGDRRWLDPMKVPTLAIYVEHFNLVRRGRSGGPVTPKTRALSDGHFRNYILPSFGHMRLDQITFPAVKEWHASIPHSASLSRSAYSLLKAVMSMAVEEELIHKNPCRVRGASQNSYPSRRHVSIAEHLRIIEAMKGPARSVALIALHTQMRRGEILALRWSDVDLEAQTINVARSLGPDGVEGPTKSGRSNTIAIDDDATELLASLRRSDAKRDECVFMYDETRRLREWHIQRAWESARKAVDLTDVRLHDARHTGGTELAMKGLPTKEVMARLGHSTVAASLNYQHRAESMRHVASSAIGAAIADARSSAAAKPRP